MPRGSYTPAAEEYASEYDTGPNYEDGVWVVTGTTPGGLKAACDAAHPGEIIELRFNGRREERPLRLPPRVTIRGQDGFAPVIVFRPMQRDPNLYPRAMFSPEGMATFVNVHVELDVPSTRQVPVEAWSLFELDDDDFVRFQNCSLTIRNSAASSSAMHPDVAFLRALSNEDRLMMAEIPLEPGEIQVELENTVARGEAVLVRAEGRTGLSFEWDNGLLSTSERFADLADGPVMSSYAGDRSFRLRHVTVDADQGFLRVESSVGESYPGWTRVACDDSVLRIASNAAVVEHSGPGASQTAQAYFEWREDRTYYDGADVFWRIRDPKNAPLVEEWRLPEWREHWLLAGPYPLGRVAWQPGLHAHLPRNARTPEDFLLAGSRSVNPAVGGARSGRNSGFALTALPTLPGPPIDVHELGIIPANTDFDIP
jgi:hypothetical protein